MGEAKREETDVRKTPINPGLHRAFTVFREAKPRHARLAAPETAFGSPSKAGPHHLDCPKQRSQESILVEHSQWITPEHGERRADGWPIETLRSGTIEECRVESAHGEQSESQKPDHHDFVDEAGLIEERACVGVQ